MIFSSLLIAEASADLDNFTWGGKGVARGVGRGAGLTSQRGPHLMGKCGALQFMRKCGAIKHATVSQLTRTLHYHITLRGGTTWPGAALMTQHIIRRLLLDSNILPHQNQAYN